MVQGTALALLKLVLGHTRSWHMSGMLSGSSEEKNQVVALTGLEILGELGVFPVNEESEMKKSPPHPQVPVGVDRVLCMVVFSFLSTK